MTDLASQISRTIEVLEPLLKNNGVHNGIPKLTLSAKRLARPPFRFIHKIITAVIRSTGAGSGLFSDSTLDVCTDKQKLRDRFDTRKKKVAFLERYIA